MRSCSIPSASATCIPGAEVTGRRDDGSYDASVTVKLGPVKMTYRGTIAIVESDPEARTATMLAKGAEERGQGTAQATLQHGRGRARGGGSHVDVSADMLVTGRVAQMGRGVMQDVARRMIAQMAQNMEALLTGGEQAETGRRRLGGIDAGLGGRRSREAHLRLRASSGPLAALAGYALLSVALFGRGVLRDGGRQRRRLVRVRPGELRVVARVVAARDRARAPPAADEPRVRAGRLESRLDELHPRPVAAGLAAHGGLRAGADLRRPGSPGARRWRPGARSSCAASSARGRGPRWQAVSSSASAPTRRPRRSTTSTSRSSSRCRSPASWSLASYAARSRIAASSCCSRSASSACSRRSWRRCSGRRSAARSRSAWGSSSREGAKRARIVPLPRAVGACVRHRARRCRAVPVGRACASRSARHQRPKATSSTSPT